MTALCLPFLATRTEVPTALLLAGRWLPAAASLVAMRIGRRGVRPVEVWGLRPGGPRRLLAGIGAGAGVGVGIAALGHAIGRVTGIVGPATLPPPAALVAALLATTVLASASTLGEEVAWRGHLRVLTRNAGFWRSALGIGAFWACWHIPLHASYVAAGVMSPHVAAASTVVLVAVAPLWAALVERFGSIWPAVVAHALPLTPLVLAGDLDAVEPWRAWAVAAIWAALSLAAAGLVAPGPRRPSRGDATGDGARASR